MRGHGGWRDGRRTASDLEPGRETRRAALCAAPNDRLCVLDRATGEPLAEPGAFGRNDIIRVDLETWRPSHDTDKVQFTHALHASVVESAAR